MVGLSVVVALQLAFGGLSIAPPPAPAAPLSGVVLVDGQVASGATVIVKSAASTFLKASTDLQGRYRLDGVPAGPATIVAVVRRGEDVHLAQEAVIVGKSESVQPINITIEPIVRPENACPENCPWEVGCYRFAYDAVRGEYFCYRCEMGCP